MRATPEWPEWVDRRRLTIDPSDRHADKATPLDGSVQGILGGTVEGALERGRRCSARFGTPRARP